MSYTPWLDAVRPHLRPPLWNERAVERLSVLAPLLPATCQVILEARLTSASNQVDLAVQLATGEEALEMARAPLPVPVREVLRRWAAPASALAGVSRMWLEFDLDDADESPPAAPVVCARLAAPPEPGWLLDTLLPALLGYPLDRATREFVTHVLAHLSGAARLLYVFALAPRPGAPLRFEWSGLDGVSTVAALTRLDARRATTLAELAPLAAGVERHHLSFDLGVEIGPRLGIEGSFPRQPARDDRWHLWLERLVGHGLADADRAAGALAWPGRQPGLVRGLSHLKLASAEGRRPEAKVYATLVPIGGWRRAADRATLRPSAPTGRD